jgi:hypothetical protein
VDLVEEDTVEVEEVEDLDNLLEPQVVLQPLL